jgi:putative phosphoesterase
MSDSRNGEPKIWVVSDTHLKSGQILPATFTNRVGRGDIIIHLGDFVSPEIIGQLQILSRMEAVSGNCDPLSIKNAFPPVKIITVGEFRIGLIHGRGGYMETVKDVEKRFAGNVDVALFGHTHSPYHAKVDGTVLFNPGSMTQSRQGPQCFGLLHLDKECAWGEVIEL